MADLAFIAGEALPHGFRDIALRVTASADTGLDNFAEREFEAVARFPDEEKKIIKALLEGMILKHEAKRLANV